MVFICVWLVTWEVDRICGDLASSKFALGYRTADLRTISWQIHANTRTFVDRQTDRQTRARALCRITHTRTHTQTYTTHTHTQTYTHTHNHTITHARELTDSLTHTRARAHTHTHTHTLKHTVTHTHLHTHKHTNTHTITHTRARAHAITRARNQTHTHTHSHTHLGRGFGLKWSERRVGTPTIQVWSLAGTASVHLDVYSQRHEHFRMDMCAIEKFLFHFIFRLHQCRKLQHLTVHAIHPLYKHATLETETTSDTESYAR
jgi:hypothetical protein